MRALIWKELRELVRPVAVAAGAFVLLSLLARRTGEMDRPIWYLSVWLVGMPVAAMLLGANAVAKERSHRTLEWQSLWPVARGAWWLAKLAASLSVLAVGYVVTGCVLLFAHTLPYADSRPLLVTLLTLAVGLGTLLFALGFLYSTLRRSPFEAFGMALLTALLAGVVWFVAMTDLIPGWFGPRLGLSLDSLRPGATTALAAALALACLAGAAWGAFPVPALAFARRLWQGSVAAVLLGLLALPMATLGLLYLSPPERPDFGRVLDVRLSPDGRRVAFTDDNGYLGRGGAPRLWVMDAGGTNLRCAARGRVLQYRWLPDIRRLLVQWGQRANYDRYLANRGDRWWWLVRADGREMRRLPLGDATAVLPSPKGTYLAGGDRLVETDTGRVVTTLPLPVTDTGQHGVGDQGFQARFKGWAWADDESALYHPFPAPSSSDYSPQERWGLTRIALPSGELTRRAFTALTAGAIDRPVQPGGWVLETLRVATVPGDARLGLTAVSTTASTLDGTCRFTFPGLDTFERPVSPDGRYLWLHDRRSRVVVAGLGTGQIARHLGGPEMLASISSHGPYWSPDGQWLAFHGRPRGEPPQPHAKPDDIYDTYVTSPDGSQPLRHFRTGGTLDPNRETAVVGWTADGALLLASDTQRLVRLDRDGQTTDVLRLTKPGRWGK